MAGSISLKEVPLTPADTPLVKQRQDALFAHVVDAPDQESSPLLCATTVMASAAACFIVGPAAVVLTCPAAVLVAVCSCREALENWDSDIDLDAICGD